MKSLDIRHDQNKMLPPQRSKNVITDILNFLFHDPRIKTKIKFRSEEKRQEYNQLIMQRVGIDIKKFSILNIHKIGIDAPAGHVFNELLNWNGDSTCWPNHVARVERKNNKIEEIRILPFGWKKYPFGIKKSFLGIRFIPLFYLNSLCIKAVPDSSEADDARYLLYESRGGYPIGIFAMYVRSSIPERNEKSQSQLFFLVSFNFYGKKNRGRGNLTSRIWEGIHDRVTANVLTRIKQLSEWRISKTSENESSNTTYKQLTL